MAESVLKVRNAVEPFRPQALVATALLNILWAMLIPAIEVSVIAWDAAFFENLPRAGQLSQPERLLEAGLFGFFGWVIVYVAIPAITGAVCAILSPRAEYANAIFPVAFILTSAFAYASLVQRPSQWGWITLIVSTAIAILAVCIATRLVIERRREELGAAP